MDVEYYSSLGQKSEIFEFLEINNREDLDSVINKYRKFEGRYMYRGLTEAKYKLYNSAQRKWITLELNKLGKSYNDFIQITIENAKRWQNKLLSKFFNAFGQPPYDISILSFLQHYGAPTPLLDWTYSFENALFFATDGLRYASSNSDIENYCSIYILDNKWKELINFLDTLKGTLSQMDFYLTNLPKIDATEELRKIESLNYMYLHNLHLTYIPGYKRGGFSFKLKSRPTFNIIYNQQNLNIINQKGLFVYNSSENKPLEYFFRGLSTYSSDVPYNLPKIICLNIHKSLNEYIKRFLTEGRKTPIDKEFIYPQEEMIANKAFINFLNFSR